MKVISRFPIPASGSTIQSSKVATWTTIHTVVLSARSQTTIHAKKFIAMYLLIRATQTLVKMAGNKFECTCTSEYIGSTCDVRVDPCSPNPCQNGGNCTDQGSNTLKCACTSNYTGSTCDIRFDPCSPDPCEHGGTAQIREATPSSVRALPTTPGLPATCVLIPAIQILV